MKIYLDTKDLIDIIEKSKYCTSDTFENLLRAKGHELILSFANIVEISTPLTNQSIETNVMQLLNRIEELPIKYIAESKIFKLELEEGFNAFNQGREYNQIYPFGDRFDDILIWQGVPSTKAFLNFSLAEAIFTLWTNDPTFFEGFQKYNYHVKKVMEIDRSLSSQPGLLVNFVKTIDKHLKTNKIIIPSSKLTPFASWIYEKNTRCPSIRLIYEVYHRIKQNIQDVPNHHDIPDLGHICCIPYVDLITLDRRMTTYATQALNKLKTGYDKRVHKNINNVISILKMAI